MCDYWPRVPDTTADSLPKKFDKALILPEVFETDPTRVPCSGPYAGCSCARGSAIAHGCRGQADVIRKLAATLFFDPRQLFDDSGNLKPVKELDPEVRMGLQSIDIVATGGDNEKPLYTKKIRWADRNQAREQAMKMLGMFDQEPRQEKPRRLDIMPSRALLEELRRIAGEPTPTPSSEPGESAAPL